VQGELPSARELAEATVIEAAALLRFSTGARSGAIIKQLGALMERSGLRTPLVLLSLSDQVRVSTALVEAGYGHIVRELPAEPIIPDPDEESLLSDRELAVLQSLMRNSSVSAIAAELVVSVNTVKSQLKSVYRNLGVSSRVQAIATAVERHLLVDREE
jgi:DNA-binding NarL/FixJ family response regulator